MTAGAPEGYRVERLAAVPGLGGLYAKGATSSARIAATRALPGSVRGGRDGSDPTLPSVALRVDHVATDLPDVADRLARYQRLVGERVGDTIPAGFLHVLGFPVATGLMTRGDFPLPLLGMVHTANSASLVRPVRLGETLAVESWAEGLRPHRRGVTVDLVTRVLVDGEPAYRGVSTYLAKGVHLGSRASDDGSAPSADRSPHAGLPFVPTGRWRLGASTGRDYAAVSGDRNPIHMSALSAKAFGFPRAIAHGMYTAARALAEVGPARGETYDWSVEFAKPVLLPSTVDVSITRGTAGDEGAAGLDRWSYTVQDSRRGRTHLRGAVTRRDRTHD
ncbi:hypothetical protein GCM10025865_08730 [Paraoerskovia sediminicola]|uniref:MaoC-like domain-containing protein n=1 Tax=Paraoerskovia sediminicola TaxID=1138587 RepID=A0ABN6X9Z7_9CELL|nr:MaoC/PaaZ C-terminal domain-containing protein [Paraoerskovia sediminicola]BDZ41574.1 hypothetical protein GCM10025865_08730 [Paraoerskovia sediminicola]